MRSAEEIKAAAERFKDFMSVLDGTTFDLQNEGRLREQLLACENRYQGGRRQHNHDRTLLAKWAVERLASERAEQKRPFAKRAADRLAVAVARLVEIGQLSARSAAADALLDYFEVGSIDGPKDVAEAIARLGVERKEAPAATIGPQRAAPASVARVHAEGRRAANDVAAISDAKPHSTP